MLGLNQFFNSEFIYCVFYICLRRVVPLLNKRGVREGAERRTSSIHLEPITSKTEKKREKNEKERKKQV